MTSQVQFHVLPEPDSAEDFFQAAIQLAESVYQHSPGQLVVLCDAADLSTLDDLLWTLIPKSFLPHRLADHGEATSRNVIDLLSDATRIKTTPGVPCVVINLSSQIPSLHNIATQHVVVGRSPEHRESCRALFRTYKKHGISLSSESIAV